MRLRYDKNFASDFRAGRFYTDDFIRQLEEAEEDIRKGRTKRFKNVKDFLKSLA